VNKTILYPAAKYIPFALVSKCRILTSQLREITLSLSLSLSHTHTLNVQWEQGVDLRGVGLDCFECVKRHSHTYYYNFVCVCVCVCVWVHTFWFSMLRNYNYDHLPSMFIVAPPPNVCVFECKSEITEKDEKEVHRYKQSIRSVWPF